MWFPNPVPSHIFRRRSQQDRLNELIDSDGYESSDTVPSYGSADTEYYENLNLQFTQTVKPSIAVERKLCVHEKCALGETCSICLTDDKSGDGLKMKCGHVFHANCINTWLERSDNCPMCRKQIKYQ